MTAARIVTLDIERIAGLAEVWDYKPDFIRPESFREPPRTICLAWKWLDSKEIQFSSEWTDGQEGMARKVHAILDEADYVVGWNSRRFDVKHLRTILLEHGLTPPSPHVDLDLMVNVKREFDFLYNRMAYIADVLGLEGKDKTPLGLWSDLRSTDPGTVARAHVAMEKYNRRDVELTEELFYLLRPWLRGMNLGLFEDNSSTIRCSNCGSENFQYRGVAGNTTYRYRRFQCNDCGKWGRDRNSFKSTQASGI